MIMMLLMMMMMLMKMIPVTCKRQVASDLLANTIRSPSGERGAQTRIDKEGEGIYSILRKKRKKDTDFSVQLIHTKVKS